MVILGYALAVLLAIACIGAVLRWVLRRDATSVWETAWIDGLVYAAVALWILWAVRTMT